MEDEHHIKQYKCNNINLSSKGHEDILNIEHNEDVLNIALPIELSLS